VEVRSCALGALHSFAAADAVGVAAPREGARDAVGTGVGVNACSPLEVPGFIPKLSDTPGSHRRNAPAIGQDTRPILREVGLSEDQIDELARRGVIATPSLPPGPSAPDKS
jgi:crotonobetainyl-CoA:carnitine CoA-transferase CaiB-like acyl-CoA transferase